MKNYAEYKTNKVIKYNWELLKQYPIKDILGFLEYCVDKSENYLYLNPHMAKVLIDSAQDKHSFIIDIKTLIANKSIATDSELFVYLDLCSKRSYFTYINTKNKAISLPIWKITEYYDINQLRMNRLLDIDENNINFRYEIGD